MPCPFCIAFVCGAYSPRKPADGRRAMMRFAYIKNTCAAFAGLALLCAAPGFVSAQAGGSFLQTDSLQKNEPVYAKMPAPHFSTDRYVFGRGAVLSDRLGPVSKNNGPFAALRNYLPAFAKADPLKSGLPQPAALKPAVPSLAGSQALTGLKPAALLNPFNPGVKLPADTLPKPGVPKVPLLPAAAADLSRFPNPLTGNDPAIQTITNTPGSLVKGINGIGSAKEQQQKMAALRSQLISESISKNFGARSRSSFSSSLSVENDFLYQPVLGAVTGKKYVNIIGVNGSLTAFGLPLTVNISNNQSAFGGTSPLNSSLFKFGFSPSMFSGLLKSDLQQYADLKNSVFHGFTFTGYVRQTLIEKVSSLESGAPGKKNSLFGPYLDDFSKLQGLIGLPDKQLRQQLETMVNEKYLSDLKSPNASQAAAQAERQVNYQKADSLAIVIGAVKTELNKNGASPDKLLLAENYLSGKTSSSFNASEAAGNMYTKKPGTPFQSFFGNIKDLRVGSFGTQVPGGTGEDAQLMKGANLGLKLGDYPLTLGYGSLNDINAVKDAGYETSVYAAPKNITYIGTEMKRGVFGDVKVAVVSSFNGQANDVHYATPTLPGNAVAFTVTKAVKVDKVGRFSFDVSKSGTLFSSSYQPGSEALLERKAGASYNLSSNLFQSLAFGFTHNLEMPALKASDNVYFNYAGLGYQNPANNGYSGATMKFGGDLRKSFYQNKLLLDFRTDYRSMPLSYTSSDKWKNYQVQLDSRYQVSSQSNVSLKYIEAATDRNIGGTSVSVYNSKKVELSGNNTFKVGKYFMTSHLSVSSQTLTNTYESASGSSLVNVNYAQSLVLKNSSLTATVFYNKELSTYVLIGDMLTTDLTYQFVLLKNLQLASGATYLNNAAIARQAGVRQSLQFVAGKHFDFNASVDLRKNLITPQYADLYPSCRGELAVKYYFKLD